MRLLPERSNPISSRLKLIKLFVLSACVTRCTNLLDNQQRHDNSLSYREPGCKSSIRFQMEPLRHTRPEPAAAARARSGTSMALTRCTPSGSAVAKEIFLLAFFLSTTARHQLDYMWRLCSRADMTFSGARVWQAGVKAWSDFTVARCIRLVGAEYIKLPSRSLF